MSALQIISRRSTFHAALFVFYGRVFLPSTEGQARFAITSTQGGRAVTEYKLCIYKISIDHMAEFTEGWRTHIVSSRERFGFKIVTALANTENGDFVWLLRWDGPEGYEAADRAYY